MFVFSKLLYYVAIKFNNILGVYFIFFNYLFIGKIIILKEVSYNG